MVNSTKNVEVIDTVKPTDCCALSEAALDLVRQAGGHRARLFVPGRAEWIQTAAGATGFKQERTIAHMLLPADVPTPQAPSLSADLRLRSIRPFHGSRDPHCQMSGCQRKRRWRQ